MTRLTLYHSTRCPYSRRVRLVLEELRIDYDEVEVSLEDPPQWFEEVSPGGKVPCVVHGDVDLVESSVIMEYLNEGFGGDLMPDDNRDRAHARYVVQWADDAWIPAYQAFERATEAGDPEAVERARPGLMKQLDALEEKFVGRSPYLVGPTLSLADVAVASTITELPRLGVSLARYPRTEGLVSALMKRASCRRVPTRPQGEVQTRHKKAFPV